MDFEERNFLVNRIVCGFLVVDHGSVVYHIFDSNSTTKYLAECYTKSIKDDYLMDGLLSVDSSERILDEKEIWTETLAKELDAIEAEIKRLKDSLPSLKFKSDSKRKVEITIGKFEKRHKALTKSKNAINVNTIEYATKIEKFKYLLFLNTYVGSKRAWDSFEFFENSLSEKMVQTLLMKGYFSENYTETDFRLLARTEPWRTIWRAATKTGRLFDKPAAEMTDYQKALVSWSMLYDNVYESSECPSEDIINDDDALDEWLEEQQNKNKNKENKPTISNSKIANSQEISIMVETPEDAQKVYSLNDSGGKGVLLNRERTLLTKGRVSESQLPDQKQRIMMEKNNAANSAIKARGHG